MSAKANRCPSLWKVDVFFHAEEHLSVDLRDLVGPGFMTELNSWFGSGLEGLSLEVIKVTLLGLIGIRLPNLWFRLLLNKHLYPCDIPLRMSIETPKSN